MLLPCNFELIYQLIVDIQNRDLEISLETALPMINAHFSNYWLIEHLLVLGFILQTSLATRSDTSATQ